MVEEVPVRVSQGVRSVHTMGRGECAVDGCTRRVTTRGWCATHYKRWQRRGTTADPVSGPPVCTVEGCGRPVDGRGLCHGHYQRRQRTGSVQAHIPLGRRRQPEVCVVEGCEGATKARGYCPMHWYRVWRHDDVEPEGLRPVVDRSRAAEEGEPSCVTDGCGNLAVARERCPSCYKTALRRGTVEVDPDVRVVTGDGHISHGYWCVIAPEDERHLTGGAAKVGEHRLVMARHLGRALLPEEQVHHINGDKLDNRLENLELWSTSHPSGQRVEDKVEWALQVLRTYRPDLLNESK